MRVMVLGGTRFIGKAVVRALVDGGHAVVVVHRGEHEPPDLPPVEHIHADRREPWPDLSTWRPDAVVDTLCMSRSDADTLVAAVPDGVRLVVLSSMDVYRGFASLRAGLVTDVVPITESSPVRQGEQRYPFGGDYEKLDVEDVVLARGCTILRLGMIYGADDPQRREGPIIDRILAGDRQIPVGAGTALLPRAWVDDVGMATRLAVEAPAAAVEGEIFNICESTAEPTGLWAVRVIQFAGSSAQLMRVPDDELPEDLALLGAVGQPMLGSSAKAAAVLGWRHSDPVECL